MYVPAHFAADDLDQIAAFVERAGSADLVTFDGTAPVSTLLPVIWDRPAGDHGRLLGHVALSNPQWSTAAAGVPALAIVHGPQAYISPSWYQSTTRARPDSADLELHGRPLHRAGRVPPRCRLASRRGDAADRAL